MARWGIGEELSEKDFKSYGVAEVIQRTESWPYGTRAMKFGPPCWLFQRQSKIAAIQRLNVLME